MESARLSPGTRVVVRHRGTMLVGRVAKAQRRTVAVHFSHRGSEKHNMVNAPWKDVELA